MFLLALRTIRIHPSLIRLMSVIFLMCSILYSKMNCYAYSQNKFICQSAPIIKDRFGKNNLFEGFTSEDDRISSCEEHSILSPVCSRHFKTEAEFISCLKTVYRSWDEKCYPSQIDSHSVAEYYSSAVPNVIHVTKCLSKHSIVSTAQPIFVKKQSIVLPSIESHSEISLDSKPIAMRSGETEILQNSHTLGAFKILFRGHVIAEGQDNPVIVYRLNGIRYTVQIQKYEATAVRMSQGGLRLSCAIQDQNGLEWGIYQNFFPGPDNSIKVHCLVTVNKGCILEYLPVITILPIDNHRVFPIQQALVPGIEYLGSDGIRGSLPKRSRNPAAPIIPPSNEITFPLMTIVGDKEYISLTWRQSAHIAALFGCNHAFPSGTNIMGLIAPGANLSRLKPGMLLASPGLKMTPGISISVNARILCGEGISVVPSVKEYIKQYGISDIPSTHMSSMQYLSLAARGWLQSKISDPPLYKAAWMTVNSAFAPKPAADVAMDMLYDSVLLRNSALSTSLAKASRSAYSVIPPNKIFSDQIANLNSPAAALVDLHAMAEAKEAESDAKKELKSSLQDFNKHAALDANHMANSIFCDGDYANSLKCLLENSMLSGNREIIMSALKRLSMLEIYSHSVPSISSSTQGTSAIPAICASANLCKDFTLGYAITGDTKYLKTADYWAWTGIPFVYIGSSNIGNIGAYGTKANILGQGDNSIVQTDKLNQSDGMEYADALWLLSKYDKTNRSLWREIANGISASAVNQAWPQGDTLNGLLPESYNIMNGTRLLPALNPCFVFTGATRLYSLPTIYSFAVCNNYCTIIHVPGKITMQHNGVNDIRFNVNLWPRKTSQILVVGLTNRPTVYLDGHLVPNNQFKYDPDKGLLSMPILGHGNIEIKNP